MANSENGEDLRMEESDPSPDNLIHLEAFLQELPGKLEKTPYDYELYAEWIRLLRLVNDTKLLSIARTQMQNMIALTQDMWIEWIEDERLNCDLNNEQSLQQINNLFDNAVNEYLSISMWQKYIDFVKGLNQNEQTRTIAEKAFGSQSFYLDILKKAVNNTGAYYPQSHVLWLEYASIYEALIDTKASDRISVIEELQSIYLERLAKPHAALDETFSQYSQFVTKYLNQNYEDIMVKANKIVNTTRKYCDIREKLEEELVNSGNSWNAYSLYLEKIKQHKPIDPKEVCTLYERALVVHYYVPGIWVEYILYVSEVVKDNNDAIRIASRAIRNCPWSGEIWAMYISISYEIGGKEASMSAYEKAIVTHALNYSMTEYSHCAVALIDATRFEYQKNLPNSDEVELLVICDLCINHAYSLPIDTADPEYQLEKCCSFIYTTILDRPELARKVWTKVTNVHNNSAEAWVLYAEFERVHGSVSNSRSIYKRASKRRLDIPTRVFDSWLLLEHSTGNLSSINMAKYVICEQTSIIQRRIEKEAHKANYQYAPETALSLTKIQSTDKKQNQELEACQDTTNIKRQRESVAKSDAEGSSGIDIREPRNENSNTAHEDMTHSSIISTENSTDLPATKRVKLLNTTTEHELDQKPTEFNTLNEDSVADRTLFVSNIPFKTTSSELSEFLGGGVESIEMLSSHEGRFRGKAKVIMKTSVLCSAATSMNEKYINNRMISVKKFELNPHTPLPQDATFRVVGFSQSTNDKQVEKIASESGKVLRIHRNKQGDKMFITMDSRKHAIEAATAVNGKVVDNRTLYASITDPAKKRQSPLTSTQANTSVTSLVPRKAAKHPAKRISIKKSIDSAKL